MGIFQSTYYFSKCYPVDDNIQPLFPCCGKEFGQRVSRYHLLFALSDLDRDQKMFIVTMSFCILQERKIYVNGFLKSQPYSEVEIMNLLREFALSCIHWPFPSFGNCQVKQTCNYRIIFHDKLRLVS